MGRSQTGDLCQGSYTQMIKNDVIEKYVTRPVLIYDIEESQGISVEKLTEVYLSHGSRRDLIDYSQYKIIQENDKLKIELDKSLEKIIDSNSKLVTKFEI